MTGSSCDYKVTGTGVFFYARASILLTRALIFASLVEVHFVIILRSATTTDDRSTPFSFYAFQECKGAD